MPNFAFSAPTLVQSFKTSRRQFPRHARRPTATAAEPGVEAEPTRIAVGTWSWGNRLLYGYTPDKDPELLETFQTAICNGVTLFDTADSYGTLRFNARAEVLLGKFLSSVSPIETSKVRIATKFASYPWRLSRRQIVNAAEKSAERLGRVVDLGQIHWSTRSYNIWQERVLWDGICDAVEQGYIREVGVSNYGPVAMKEVFEYMLHERGIKLASAQSQFSLLCRNPLTNGTFDVCRALNIQMIGYSPLCLGYLTDRYSITDNPGGIRGALFRRLHNPRLKTLLSHLAQKHSATTAQIALAYCLQQPNLTVLVGCNTPAHTRTNLSAQHIKLSISDMEQLEYAASTGRQMPQNAFQTV